MFISRDPIGLNGGLNTFQYGLNPIGWIDVFGLKGAYMFETLNGTCYVGKGAWGRYLKSTRQRSRNDGSKKSTNEYDDAVPKGTHITVKSPCSQVDVDDYAEMVEHMAMLLLKDNVKNKLYNGCKSGFANDIASPGVKKLEAKSSICSGLKLSATTDATKLYNQFILSTSRR